MCDLNNQLIEQLNVASRQYKHLLSRGEKYSELIFNLEKQLNENIQHSLRSHKDEMNEMFTGILRQIPTVSSITSARITSIITNSHFEYTNTSMALFLNAYSSVLNKIHLTNQKTMSLGGKKLDDLEGLSSGEIALEANLELLKFIKQTTGNIFFHIELHEGYLGIFNAEHIQQQVDFSFRLKTIETIEALKKETLRYATPEELMATVTRLVELGIPLAKELFIVVKCFVSNSLKHPIQSVQPTKESYEQGIITLHQQLNMLNKAMDAEQDMMKQAYQSLRELHAS